MTTEWVAIQQCQMFGPDRVAGYTATFPCGVGYVYRLDGLGLWYGSYEPAVDGEGGERMTSEPLWRRAEAFLWCERMGGVAPVALSLGI